MCLGIPGKIIEFVDEPNNIAKADVSGVRRNVNVGAFALHFYMLLFGEDLHRDIELLLAGPNFHLLCKSTKAFFRDRDGVFANGQMPENVIS